MNTTKRLIESRTEVELLVDSFYSKVNNDALLAPLFVHINWPAHIPTMYKFWSSMLLGEQSYQGNPFEKHKNLSIQCEHFNRWVELFQCTVDENFEGEKAQEAKDRASHIANVFQNKMGLFK